MIKIPRRARLSILGAAGIVFSTTGGAAEQSGALVVPCEGKGRLVSSPVTVEAMGGSMTLGHGTDDAVQVAVEECGRRVIIDAPQARIELLRSVFDPAQLEGTVVTKGEPAEWTLSQVHPKLLTGEAVNTRPQGTATADVTLKMTEATAPDLEGCREGENAAPAEIGPVEAAASDVLMTEGRRLPPDRSIDDYIKVTHDGEETSRVYAMLSGDGQILPLRADAVTLEALCAGSGWLDPARTMLAFKIFQHEGATSVSAQRVDIETGLVQEQYQHETDGSSAVDLRAAMTHSLQGLATQPGHFSDGAGE